MRKSTVYDVAKKAGVSTATVSFTFRHPDKVKDKTRKKVLDAAAILDYVPSASARGLARGKTGALGLYSFDMLLERPQGSELEDLNALNEQNDSSFTRPNMFVYPLYVDEIQRGFELECWHRGKTVLLGTANSPKENNSITDIAGSVDGLAVFPNHGTDDLPLPQLCRTVPLVRIGDLDNTLSCASIYCDNTAGIISLIDHLIDIHHITDMSFIGEITTFDMRSRFNAFQQHVTQRGIQVTTALLDNSEATSQEWMVKLCEAIDTNQLPQAIVCANDQTALNVMEILTDAGIRIPEDILITGFDGIMAAEFSRPPITTVRQPMEHMGRLAAKLLDERAGIPWDSPQSYKLPVRMIIGESCGCKTQ